MLGYLYASVRISTCINKYIPAIYRKYTIHYICKEMFYKLYHHHIKLPGFYICSIYAVYMQIMSSSTNRLTAACFPDILQNILSIKISSICSIYAVYMQYIIYILYIYAVYMQYICSIYAVYMQYICSIYAVYMQYICSIYAVYMQYIYSIYAVYIQYICSIYAVYMQYIYSI